MAKTVRMHVGIADHLGWAIAVTADAGHDVVDRRRIELVEPGLSAAPIHYDRGRSDDDSVATLIEEVRASIVAMATMAFDEIETALAEPVTAVSLRQWPDDFPDDLATLRKSPYEARADAVMYRQVLADVAADRGWSVHVYDAKTVLSVAADLLGDRADEVLQGPRARLGPPWAKDHRVALAATVVAG